MGFFHLVIRKEGPALTASARSDPSSKRVITLPNSDSFKADLTNLRARGAEGPQIYVSQEVIATRIGEQLFSAISPPPIDDLFREYARSKKPRLALHIPRSLFALPWEVLKDPRQKPGRFLSRTGSVVRCDDVASSGASPPHLRQMKFLAVSSNPSNRPILGDIGWRNSKGITFRRVKPPTFDNFSTAIANASDCDGFVFWGHGDLDPDTRSGVLVFVRRVYSLKRLITYEGDPIQAFNVAIPFAQPQNPLRFAYVFACESAFWDDPTLDFKDCIVGSLLDRTALTSVLGAQTNIDVRAAEACLDESLDALNRETPLPLDLAITEGRNRILRIPSNAGSKFSALDWWVPAVYVKPEFLDSLANVELPSDAAAVPYPAPESVATAAPAGGLAAAQGVSALDAFKNVAGSTLKGMFT